MYTKNIIKKILVVALFVSVAGTLPTVAMADVDDLEVAGWVPYWSGSKGIKDAKSNLNTLTTIHPFVFTVKADGTLNDLGDIKSSSWKSLFSSAKRKRVEVIPTVMSSDTTTIYNILSNETLRKNHIDAIVDMVKKGKYDGVDIDYEGKSASTKEYFSLFIIELKKALGSKTLACTIEARTPPDSLYKVVPTTLEYVNDYAVIGKYCDTVEIMTYDQQRADLKLNAAKIGAPYIPVADIDWVRKVAELAVQSIPREKIMLGVATYGAEWQIIVSPNWYQDYTKLWALNPSYGVDTAKKLKITPTKSKAGEMSFSYFTPEMKKIIDSENLSIPKNTPSSEKAAAQALAYANKTGKTVFVNYVTWSDAGAIEQKAELADELNLRGIAIFKVDGGEDKKIWDIFD